LMSASNDNDDNVVIVDKQGFLEIQPKKGKWKAYWFILLGGSLHYYKTPLDATAYGSYKVKDASIEEILLDKGKGSRKNKGKEKSVFSVKSGDSTDLFRCVNVEDRESWMMSLEAAKSKEETKPPSKEQGKRKRGSLMFRAKKSVGSKMATSSGGKGMMKRLADDDTTQLLAALKKVVTKYASQKRADEIENNILKIAVKCYFLIDNKSLRSQAFLDVDGPLREAFELCSKIYDKMHTVTDQALKDAFARVNGHFLKTESILENLLLPYCKKATIQRLKDTFSFLANPKFLWSIFHDESLEDEIHDLVKAMEYYTQFHVYKD